MSPHLVRPIPIWPLPLAIALLFTAAAHLGLWLSVREGYIEPCLPVLDGCTSISRAGRHGLANAVFRLLVLPCALLVGLHWWLVARWLGPQARAVAWLGVAAALALAVYATFLGTEGETYRFLRRYGVVCFFGFGYLAQLGFLRAARPPAPRRGLLRAMVAVSALMLLLGVANVAAGAMAAGLAAGRVVRAACRLVARHGRAAAAARGRRALRRRVRIRRARWR